MFIYKLNTLKINLKFIVSLSLFCLSFALLIVILAPSAKIHAASPSFNAGMIIDNTVFTNSSSMSVAQIQNALNSHVSCDTYGQTSMTYYVNENSSSQYNGEVHSYSFSGATQVNGTYASYGEAYANFWNNRTRDSQGDTRPSAYIASESVAPYVCLPQYVENPSNGQNNLQNPSANISGGESSAQIIYNAAQAYDINPEVLITTLQKEQGLVTDNWPWVSEYHEAMGFNCPDSGGCSGYSGFYQQVNAAAAQYRNYLDNPENFNYEIGNNTISYSPNCGASSNVYIQNTATAALYDYTPYQPDSNVLNTRNSIGSANGPGAGISDSCATYGNFNFWWYFNSWFGSTSYASPYCSSRVSGVACVWQLHNSTYSDLLTVSNSIRDTDAEVNGYSYDGMPFYAFTSNQSGTVPVYEVALSGEYFYTINYSEYESLVSSGNTGDGIVFYAYPSNTSTNASYPIYRLNCSSGHIFTASASEESNLAANGCTYEGVAFNSPSGFALTADPSNSYLNLYRLSSGAQHFYTTDLTERDSVLSSGWNYEGAMLQVPSATYASSENSLPVYRLYDGYEHFFTADPNEKVSLVSAGWTYEGIGWYVDSTVPPVYRFNINGYHFYTSSINEALAITNISGIKYEEVAFGYNQGGDMPIYRFRSSTGHFFTENVNEALQINNAGWTYEGVAFYASPTTTSTPVYRLYGSNQHFFTANAAEESQLKNSAGWTYEGVAFYASPTTTSTPVYRLYYNGQHFYTANPTERDTLVGYGWTNEGIAFYAYSN